jgi:CHAT domain-containing protein
MFYESEGKIIENIRGREIREDNNGSNENALYAYSDAISTVNMLRKAPLGYRLDSTYLVNKIELFENAIKLAYYMGKGDRCYEFIELIKSRILTATLSIPLVVEQGEERGVGPLVNDPSIPLKKRFSQLTYEIDSLEYAGYNEGFTPELQQRRTSLLDERDALLERIRFSDPHWRVISQPVPFDLNEIANMLLQRKQKAHTLFYNRTQGEVIAVLIKENGKVVCDKVLMSPSIESKLDKYQHNLQTDKPNPELFDPCAQELSIDASDLVPSSLMKEAVQNDGGLIIVPHGPLHLVPWAALTLYGKRLFEYCPIGILPNLSCIRLLNSSDNISAEELKIAIVGPPTYQSMRSFRSIVGAEKEIELVETTYLDYGKKVLAPKLCGSTYAEENFWKLALRQDITRGGILHIACHGTFDPYEPMNSALLLDNSKVDAAEIALHRIKYEEVVLSACSTGWRPSKVQDIELVGDDLLGLPGAFLEAGAKSVLVSIPPADDAAASQFMELYHENRVEGLTPLLALQKSQKTMLANAIFSPYSWVGFSVYGCS